MVKRKKLKYTPEAVRQLLIGIEDYCGWTIIRKVEKRNDKPIPMTRENAKTYATHIQYVANRMKELADG